MTRKVLLVTGASRGVGAVFAAKAAAAGHVVVATARDPRILVERFDSNPNVLVIALDVSDEVQAHAAAMAVMDRFGRIDVLLNKAEARWVGAVADATAAQIDESYRTNVFGLLAVTRAVLPYMRTRGSGHLITFGADARDRPGQGVYASTRLAVEGLSTALARELRPFGIRVTVVDPAGGADGADDPEEGLADRLLALVDEPPTG
jgi:NAD(P)-dependent dehydrogenase (short-subunit alcohol dehydrogenase family)